MRIINVPIESYTARYTEQWNRWIPEALTQLGAKFITIEGDTLTNTIDSGSVLDVCGTNYYKATQLAKILKMIKDGEVTDDDIFFFHDLWMGGIESLQYVRDMLKIRFKITGILHAGTWDIADFVTRNGMRPWAKYIEQGWLSFIDKVFLGSEFHKELISNYFKDSLPNITKKLVVTGLPFDYIEANYFKGKKENIIVFPHRLDIEKNPQRFEQLKVLLQDTDYKFVYSIKETKSKEEYYELLGKSKIAVSFADQETFGYSMLEACANSCYIFVPNKLSYANMKIYSSSYYASIEDLAFKIRNIEKAIPSYSEQLKVYTPKLILSKIIENMYV